MRTTQQDHEKAAATRGISRRTVARGMAWTAPVVLTSVAVPAVAASTGPCTNPTILLGEFVTTETTFPDGKTDDAVHGIQFGSGTSAFSATVSYTTTGTIANHPKLPGSTSRLIRTVFDTAEPEDLTPNYDVIMLHHAYVEGVYRKGDTISATIRFAEPVRNVSFTITDIDYVTDWWIDNVFVTPTGTVVARGASVLGTGEPEDPSVEGSGPFEGKVLNDLKSSAGDVTLTWPEYVSEIVVTYVAADEQNLSTVGQYIGLGKFSVSSC